MKNEPHTAPHDARRPIAGTCVDIDGSSWHKDGQVCEHCGFGIDDFGDARGFWREPLVQLPIDNAVTTTAAHINTLEASS
jgi:hypothetical protein